jgi:3-deoxy-D-manno-octulosonate 8-phosphate phosphatase (KDO 8-P phosphatase)
MPVSKIDLKNIDLIVYDFDGVMTDNKVLVFEDGQEAVFCNRADGLAIGEIKKRKVPQVILSTETNKVVKVRAQKLGIEVVCGVADKKVVLVNYCKERGYHLNKTLYIGNDLNDLEAMQAVGHPFAPEDASEAVKNTAEAIIPRKGGDGVIRELFETVLEF